MAPPRRSRVSAAAARRGREPMTVATGAAGGGTPAVTAIDCHAHVMLRDRPLASQRHSAPTHDATIDEYLAVLDAHGIWYALLTAPSFYGADNTLLLETLDAHPHRLRGTAIVDPDIEEETLAAL